MLNVQHLCSFVHAALDLFFRGLAQLQAKRHVFVHRHVRVQCVVLEHHCNVAVLRGHVIDHLVANVKLAF
ncbi:hypothetical protein SDC9_207936 [bioreactor metagenome]|uniref:Uncharacterized protein n=1 Tax=bioreactor metagenome TaxID=1076179 RepID=A0A645J9C1_9ZZZZ